VKQHRSQWFPLACSLLFYTCPGEAAFWEEAHPPQQAEPTFSTNFSDIPVIEYIRFLSRVGNINFSYRDEDLQFHVNIVSETPITIRSMISALVQILRANGLSVTEDGQNVLISNNLKVQQIPTVLSGDGPIPPGTALATRIYDVHNVNLESVATIVRALSSTDAQIEVIPETSQLVITDAIDNVTQVEKLIQALTSPTATIRIEEYHALNVPASTLIATVQKLLAPITAGRPFNLIKDPDTNSIFIVSTPYLIERTKMMLAQLDTSERAATAGENVLLYKPLHRSARRLLGALDQLSRALEDTPTPPKAFIQTIQRARLLGESGSILFIGNAEALDRIKELLVKLDTAVESQEVSERESYLVYKVQHTSPDQIEKLHTSLLQVANDLEKGGNFDPDLVHAIQSFTWIKDTGTLIFTGTDVALQKIQELLRTFDVSPELSGQLEQAALYQVPTSTNFWIYKPQHLRGDDLLSALSDLSVNLKEAGLADAPLLHVFATMRWVPSTSSLVFTGSPKSLAEMQEIVSVVDSQGATVPSVYFYKPQYISAEKLRESLDRVRVGLNRQNSSDERLYEAISSAQWMPESRSLAFHADPDTITKLKDLIASIDVPEGAAASQSSYALYKLVNSRGDMVIENLKELAVDLKKAGAGQEDLIHAIDGLQWVKENNSILITGTPLAVEEVQNLIPQFDVATTPPSSSTYHVGPSTFLIYKVQNANPQDFMSALRAFAKELSTRAPLNEEIAQTIDGMKWIPETHSILFSGPQAALEKIEAIAEKFDVAAPRTRTVTPSTFVVYTPKYVNGATLEQILEDFKQSLVQADVSDPGLFEAIDHLKWIPRTCSLLISGDADSIGKVQALLERFDVPSGTQREKNKEMGEIGALPDTSFLVYKLQYHQGSEIQDALRKIAADLGNAATPSPTSQLAAAVQSIQWIPVTNSLVAHGDPAILGRLRELIGNLDVPLRQVFIEILVITTSLTNTQAFGLQWMGKLQYLNKFATGGGNFPSLNPTTGTTLNNAFPGNFGTVNSSTTPNANTMITPIGGTSSSAAPTGFDLGIIGDIILHKGRTFLSLGSLVNALQTDTDSTVLLNPKIVTQDNNNSTIFVGQNIPFVGSQVTNTSNNTLQSTSIEYRDVGFNFSLTPVIGNDNTVTLDVSIDLSQTTSNSNSPTGSNSVVTGIQTTHTTMQTRVQVPDRHFVALSGMIQDTKDHFRSAIPCLGGLPVIGALFSENDRQNTKSNIIIFVRPYLIHSFEEYREITEHQEVLYKDQASLPILKEEFDAALDVVKSPDDE